MKNIVIMFLSIIILILFGVIIFMGCKVPQTTVEVKKENIEIERKFLINDIKDIPYDLTKADIFDIDQRYLTYDPEIRIRKVNNTEFYTTFKSGKGLTRQEFETKITEEQYNNLLKKSEGNVIEKTRYQLNIEGEYAAIDVFKGMFEGLIYFEVEFDSEEKANNYTPPTWVGKDVTEIKEYKNGSLSKNGMPIMN